MKCKTRCPVLFHASLWGLLCLLAGQYLLLLWTPWSTELVGDEFSYVLKSAFLLEHGRFPELTAEQREVLAGKGVGWSDFRPPGYPIVLAAFGIPESGIAGKQTYCTVMFGLVAMVLIAMHLAATAMFRGGIWLYPVAATLGIQPWTFEYMKSLAPDCLTMVLATTAVALLAIFVHMRSVRTALMPFVSAVALLCLTAMLRPEMLLFAVVLAAIAILVRAAGWREFFFFAGVMTCLVGCTIAANVAYRWTVAQELRVYGELRNPAPGLFKWIKTWNSKENVLHGVVWTLPRGGCAISDIPAGAFADDYERNVVSAIVERLNAGEGYAADMDTAFSTLAERRIRDNPLSCWLGPRLWRPFHLWGNLETNGQLLHALVFVPRMPRRSILGGLLVLKLTILSLSAFACVPLWRRWRSRRVEWFDVLAILSITLVATRTLLFGVLFVSCEHRYVLVAWPACLWLAIYGGFYLVHWPKRSPAGAEGRGETDLATAELAAVKAPRLA